MIVDAKQWLSRRDNRTYDVCIAGAGAAGITIALALNNTGPSVMLLEGGGLLPPSDDRELDLYRGDVIYRQYPLESSRLRYFGGSTNHWGGWCRPLDAIDLEKKPQVPLSGWPIEYAELSRWYDRAHSICEINETDYSAEALARSYDGELIDWLESGFENKLFRFSPPTRFGELYYDIILNSANILCVLNCNLIDIEAQDDYVKSFMVATLAGSRGAVKAAAYVLALGGIENPRMLLNSSNNHESAALGNQSQWVGRCFMDHFGFGLGHLLARANLRYHRFMYGASEVLPVISLTSDSIEKEGYLNFGAYLEPESADPSMPTAYWSNALSPQPEIEAWYYRLGVICEPTPNPQSRVYLSGETDALGMRRVVLDWRVNDLDFESVVRVMRRLATTVGAAGIGRIRQDAADDLHKRFSISSSSHHIGTTRMSLDARFGVVDQNCRVHGSKNLFVAGSSVFPTAGFSNPTLTIVALALRLASQLRVI